MNASSEQQWQIDARTIWRRTMRTDSSASYATVEPKRTNKTRGE